MKLNYIHIKLETSHGRVEDIFRANLLGETVCRQRAASRVAAMTAAGAKLLCYTENMEDGSTREIDS